MFESLDALEADGPVLVRVDLNSPIEDGHVQDNRRFPRHAETIADLAGADHPVIVLAHQGRPGRETFVSLEEHAAILAGYLDREVSFCPDIAGDDAARAVGRTGPGDVLLLENVRMEADELADRTPAEHAEAPFVRTLARLGSAYVGDAYSAAHRAHASIVGLPTAMEKVYAGRVMAAEYAANSAIREREFPGDVAMVLGGTKADDLFRVIAGVRDRVDTFLLGGVIGELALRGRGHDLGYDVPGTERFDDLWAEHSDRIGTLLDELGERIELPTDLAFVDADGERAERPVDGIDKSEAYLDIGSGTAARYADRVRRADAVFVKGALGVFEDARFSHGTVTVLRAIGEGSGFSVVGGGDTSRAIDLYDLDPAAYDHVSIAGGAYVRALAGEALPGVTVLEREGKS